MRRFIIRTMIRGLCVCKAPGCGEDEVMKGKVQKKLEEFFQRTLSHE
jgi:hypothetical protein